MRRLALLLLVFGGCVLPTLEALEAERPRACDGDHPCAAGYACVERRCVKGAAPECEAGEMRVCGSAVGECRPGLQRCDGGVFDVCVGGVSAVMETCDGKDNDCDTMTDEEAVTPACERLEGVCQGARRACVGGVAEAVCSAASYGPLYEATETSCDGRDNDCDGATDESLPARPCALTRGVCALATTSCRGGAYPACTTADYAARDSGYELAESRCDGLDNDCDGLTDISAPLDVSDAGPLAQRVAVVARPSGDQLALYEVGPRVMTRVLFADGGLSAERFPSMSVSMAVQRAELPALTISGAQVMEGWFELLPTMRYRLVVARADELGEATVGGVPSVALVQPPLTDGGVSVPAGQGQALRLAMTASRLVVAWANFDEAGTSTSVSLASCPIALDGPCPLVALGAGRSPSLLVEGDQAWVAFEAASGVRVTRVAVPASGLVTLGATVDLGSAGAHDPVLTGTGAALSVFFVAPGTPQTLSRATGNCTGACASSGFTTTSMLASFVGTPSSFAVEPSSGAAILAWEEGLVGARSLKVMRVGTAPVDVGPGRRPVPLIGAGNTPYLFFDGEAPATVQRRTFCSL